MDVVYDALEAAPATLQSLVSLVLLALTLVVVAGVLVAIPVVIAFGIYDKLIARRQAGASQEDKETPLIPIAAAREGKAFSRPRLIISHGKRVA